MAHPFVPMAIISLVIYCGDYREYLVVLLHPEWLNFRTWTKPSLTCEKLCEVMFIRWHPVLIVAVDFMGKIYITLKLFAST
jgi:hypothetical protein